MTKEHIGLTEQDFRLKFLSNIGISSNKIRPFRYGTRHVSSEFSQDYNLSALLDTHNGPLGDFEHVVYELNKRLSLLFVPIAGIVNMQDLYGYDRQESIPFRRPKHGFLFTTMKLGMIDVHENGAVVPQEKKNGFALSAYTERRPIYYLHKKDRANLKEYQIYLWKEGLPSFRSELPKQGEIQTKQNSLKWRVLLRNLPVTIIDPMSSEGFFGRHWVRMIVGGTAFMKGNRSRQKQNRRRRNIVKKMPDFFTDTGALWLYMLGSEDTHIELWRTQESQSNDRCEVKIFGMHLIKKTLLDLLKIF